MTWDQILGLAIALTVMLVGVAGAIIPGIPSTPIVWAAAVLHRLYFGDGASASWMMISVMGVVMLFSLLMDFVASMIGARKLGATRRGVLGAVVGGIIGIFFSLPGILLGPFIGALIFELSAGRKLGESAKSGLGATLGLLAGALGKMACCVAMIVLFTFGVLSADAAPAVFESTPEIANLVPEIF